MSGFYGPGGHGIIGAVPGGPGTPFFWHADWPEGAAQGGNTISYELWWPSAVTLTTVQAYMATKNSTGAYTMAITNRGTGNRMLTAATLDMNTLSSGAVTNVVLTSTAADLLLPANTRMTIALASDNANFNGSGIYFSAYAVVT